MRHLKDNNMSYFEHLRFAMKLALQLKVLALISVVHAICPFVLQNHVSSGVKSVNDKLQEMAN
jgi:hypothetical protein